MGKRILVVDDASFIRTMIRDILVPLGFEIAGEASSAEEAVKKYWELRPDLVTMDIKLKERDGLEAARDILKEFPDARIVIITAFGQEKTITDSVRLGVKDFVVKPFDLQRIVSAVEKALA